MCVCLSQGVPSLKVRQVPPTCRNDRNFKTICYPCMARMKVSKILLKVAYLGLLKKCKKIEKIEQGSPLCLSGIHFENDPCHF